MIIVIPSLIGVLDGVLLVSAEREQKGLAISSALVFFSFSVNVNADEATKDLSLSSGHNADSGTLIVDLLMEGIKVAAMKAHSVEVDESELSVSEPLVEHVVVFRLVNEGRVDFLAGLANLLIGKGSTNELSKLIALEHSVLVFVVAEQNLLDVSLCLLVLGGHRLEGHRLVFNEALAGGCPHDGSNNGKGLEGKDSHLNINYKVIKINSN